MLVASVLGGLRVDGALVDRRPVASPTSTLLDASSGRVVASPSVSMFLAQGQRVTSDGALVDVVPERGAEGHAVAWKDGWLVVHAGRELDVRHVGALGPARSLYRAPSQGVLLDAASASGRIVILEGDRTDADALWLTVADDREVLRRTKVGRARGARAVAMRGGFLVVSWIAAENSQWSFKMRRLDRDGNPVLERIVERWPLPTDVFLTAGDARAILVVGGLFGRHTIIDEQLTMTPPVEMSRGLRFSRAVAMGDRFVLPYGVQDVRDAAQIREWRARVIRHDGTTESDAPADPIAGADRIGTRYLVARPWGDAAIAEDDPRRVVSPAVRLRLRSYDHAADFGTITSGDVTLAAFGRYPFSQLSHFVRIDANGEPIDALPRLMPSVVYRDSLRQRVTAASAGFAFGVQVGREIHVRLLARRGEWTDTAPAVVDTGTYAYEWALHGNDDGLLLAWMTETEILTVRLDHDGTPLQLVPDRFPQPSRGRDINSGRLEISGAGSDRLIVVQQSYCSLGICSPNLGDLRLQAMVLGADGRVAGSPTIIHSRSAGAPVTLPGGSWMIPFSAGQGPEILHVASDGVLLARAQVPELTGGITDAMPTATGWQAIVESARVIEFDGASTPKRMTGFTRPRIPTFFLQVSPRFAAGGRVVYIDDSDVIGSVPVPWSARVVAEEGDLSIRLTDLGRRGNEHFFSVAVRNKANRQAKSVVVTDYSPYGSSRAFPSLSAGEEVHFVMTSVVLPYGTFAPRFVVVSDDVADTDPSDNMATFDDVQALPARGRPARF